MVSLTRSDPASPTARLDHPTATGSSSSADETLVGEEGPQRRAPRVLERGSQIGRYVVLDRLGAGGMGVVYAAYDPELDRKVAVKLLRTGHDGPDIAGAVRLLAEAKAMAALSHPNVVTVHDVGTHDGDVFVAMEFVDGWTLRQWLEREPPPARAEILAVFQAAGAGLVAAHAAGMIHRDFKPDNVMLGRDGRVRVMDFGLARRLGGSLAERPASTGAPASVAGHGLTETGALVGTPAYMAPEQYFGKPVDARSDQFGFCVALYEAIYGQRPYGGDSSASIAYELQLGELRAEPSDVVVPGWLRRVLLRGLSIEPAERFADMGSLLAELAVDRRGPWRRAGAAVGALLLLTGAVTWGYYGRDREPEPCSGGGERMVEIWDDARAVEIERAFAASGKPYAEDTWLRLRPVVDQYANAWEEGYREACEATHVRGEQSAELLDVRMICLRERLEGLRGVVEAFASVDVGAASALEHAIELVDDLPDVAECADLRRLTAPLELPSDPERREAVAAVYETLARVRTLASSGDYAKGSELAVEAVAQARSLGHAPTTADALAWLGRLEHLAGRHRAAEASLLEAVDVAALGHHDRVAARAWVELVAVVGGEQARAVEGHLLARMAAAANQRADTGAREQADLAMAVAGIHQLTARYDDARAELLRALALREGELGPDHPDVAATLVGLGDVAREQGHYDEATARFEAARSILETTLGRQHPEVARVYSSLGNVAIRSVRLEDAVRYHREALAIREASLGARHPDVAASLNNLAAAHEHRGELDEALALNLRALEIRREALGDDHPKVAMSLNNIGNVYKLRGDVAAATAHLEQALAIKSESLGPEHPSTAETLGNLANLYVDAKDFERALDYHRRTLVLFERSLGPDHPNVGAAHLNVASVHVERGDWEAVAAEAQLALASLRKTVGEEHQLVGVALRRLGQADLEAGRHDAGSERLANAERIFVAADSATDVLAVHGDRIRYCLRMDQRREAEALARRLLEVLDSYRGRPELAAEIERAEQWLHEQGLR
jgi:tetratricopeptide (TPR) repeat protein